MEYFKISNYILITYYQITQVCWIN